MDIVSGMPDLVFSPIHGRGVLVDFIGIIGMIACRSLGSGGPCHASESPKWPVRATILNDDGGNLALSDHPLLQSRDQGGSKTTSTRTLLNPGRLFTAASASYCSERREIGDSRITPHGDFDIRRKARCLLRLTALAASRRRWCAVVAPVVRGVRRQLSVPRVPFCPRK